MGARTHRHLHLLVRGEVAHGAARSNNFRGGAVIFRFATRRDVRGLSWGGRSAPRRVFRGGIARAVHDRTRGNTLGRVSARVERSSGVRETRSPAGRSSRPESPKSARMLTPFFICSARLAARAVLARPRSAPRIDLRVLIGRSACRADFRATWDAHFLSFPTPRSVAPRPSRVPRASPRVPRVAFAQPRDARGATRRRARARASTSRLSPASRAPSRPVPPPAARRRSRASSHVARGLAVEETDARVVDFYEILGVSRRRGRRHDQARVLRPGDVLPPRPQRRRGQRPVRPPRRGVRHLERPGRRAKPTTPSLRCSARTTTTCSRARRTASGRRGRRSRARRARCSWTSSRASGASSASGRRRRRFAWTTSTARARLAVAQLGRGHRLRDRELPGGLHPLGAAGAAPVPGARHAVRGQSVRGHHAVRAGPPVGHGPVRRRLRVPEVPRARSKPRRLEAGGRRAVQARE